ncbi:double zinc ribbon domain-containing protein [Deefgea rivuli]|uniref:double zinc ribbon domain-containing protein n=1 Tax=Deefgea rivuli TaxID=400948 RepID=UPI000487F5E4|nr:zinc ribbon domain-containing protein [Deefgea rivuli]
MKCLNCNTENKAGIKFCAGCGNSLTHACLSCGQHNPIEVKFCRGCGAKTALIQPLDVASTIASATPDISSKLQDSLPQIQHSQEPLVPPNIAPPAAAATQSDATTDLIDAPAPLSLPKASIANRPKHKSHRLQIVCGVVLLIGFASAGALYLSNPAILTPDHDSHSASGVIAAHTASPSTTTLPTATPAETAIPTPEVTPTPEATAIATDTPTALPVIITKTTVKPKPSRSPKPTRTATPPRESTLNTEREIQATELPTPKTFGFAEKFAACARLDFIHRAACEVKLCFNNSAAPECKHEPSIQDQHRR